MRIKKTKRERLQEIVAEYRSAGQAWPATATDIAWWAIRHHKWEAEPRSQADECARELAEAMREEYFTDSHGRHVRKKHAVRTTELLPDGKYRQLTLWVDIEDAEPQQMRTALQQRRAQVLGDCIQLKTDVDWYNENNKHEATIQMSFDFSEDIAELEQPAEYSPGG
jgi:hypothetical protein